MYKKGPKQYVKRNNVKLLTLVGKDTLIVNEESVVKTLVTQEQLFEVIEDCHKNDSIHAGIRKTHGNLKFLII